MIISIFEFIKNYGTPISSICAVITLIFAMYKYYIERRTELFWKEFESFHKLIKELVEPSSEGQSMKLDRQIIIIFELKHYKRYYPVSLRILKRLKVSWNKPEVKDIIDEIDITIKHIENTGDSIIN